MRLKVVGDTQRFEPKIRALIEQAEHLTAANQRLTLTIAANYGGRWDILQARQPVREGKSGRERRSSEEQLAPYLAMSYAPEPDLFIRTGGEQRVSNFLLWQLAYSELLFHRYAVAGLRRRGARRSVSSPTAAASAASAAPASRSSRRSGPRSPERRAGGARAATAAALIAALLAALFSLLLRARCVRRAGRR